MKLTASRLALAETCLGAAVLAGVHTPSTEAQAAGTGRHRFLERAAAVGRDAALAEIPEDATWRATCEAIDLSDLPAGEYEVAYAYDVTTDTARRLGAGLERQYGDTAPTEITGTADLVATGADGRLVVDFKGRVQVAPAATNLQLGFYALCAARCEPGTDEIHAALAYVHEDGTLEWDRATLGAFDLEAVAARLRELFARVTAALVLFDAGRLPDFHAGPHCLRCPALALCPAQAQAAREILRESAATDAVTAFADQLARLSDEDAGRALERLERVRAYADAGLTALRERAKLRGLPLPDGSRLVPEERTRRTLAIDAALPVLRARFGDQADLAVERTLSVEAVTRLARQLAPGKGQKKAAEELFEELAAAGAVKVSRYLMLKTVRARMPADAEDAA